MHLYFFFFTQLDQVSKNSLHPPASHSLEVIPVSWFHPMDGSSFSLFMVLRAYHFSMDQLWNVIFLEEIIHFLEVSNVSPKLHVVFWWSLISLLGLVICALFTFLILLPSSFPLHQVREGFTQSISLFKNLLLNLSVLFSILRISALIPPKYSLRHIIPFLLSPQWLPVAFWIMHTLFRQVLLTLRGCVVNGVLFPLSEEQSWSCVERKTMSANQPVICLAVLYNTFYV